ncbi:MAG: TRAP transporter small permease [Deltaproteobacteria bacterium]|nr:TRAP transporter small permease [Deltaproteobacteria bacterium]
MNFILSFFNGIDRLFARVVEAFLILTLFLMGGLTLAQVILRGVFDSGILGAEVVSRHLVLWIAFLGGMLGTRNRQHIAIDMLTRFLPRRPRNAVRILLDSVAFTVAFFLAKASWTFVQDERMAGATLIGHLPVWWAEALIPFGFAVIALEYAIGIVLDVKRIVEVGNERHTAGDWRKYISK